MSKSPTGKTHWSQSGARSPQGLGRLTATAVALSPRSSRECHGETEKAPVTVAVNRFLR